MHAIARHRHAFAFIVVYACALGVLVVQGRPLEDVIGALIILGGFLPAVALAATVRLPQPSPPAAWRRDDAWLLSGLLAWVAVFLLYKGQILTALLPDDPGPRLQDTVNTLLKLTAFVIVPAAVLRLRGFRWTDAGTSMAPRWRIVLAFVAMAAAAFVVQATMGSQFKRLLGDAYSGRALWLAGALCWAWMSIEAGIVEEFFFRWFLQSRLAAWTGSQVAAVLLSALVFGLAHAPGIVLRGGGAVEGLGEAPGVGTTLAYVIATQCLAGVAFGVLWARTRSFVLVVLLHGLFDAFSNTAAFIDTWRL